jgi:probable phosphoglycerate mutase
MVSIYLIRHGETDFNKEGRIQGRIETDLNPTGIEQCKKTAQFLLKNKIDFDYCYVYPQKRAIQSLEIIKNHFKHYNKNFDVFIYYNLTEIH